MDTTTSSRLVEYSTSNCNSTVVLQTTATATGTVRAGTTRTSTTTTSRVQYELSVVVVGRRARRSGSRRSMPGLWRASAPVKRGSQASPDHPRHGRRRHGHDRRAQRTLQLQQIVECQRPEHQRHQRHNRPGHALDEKPAGQRPAQMRELLADVRVEKVGL